MSESITKSDVVSVKLSEKTAKNGCIVGVNKYVFENHCWYLVKVKHVGNLGDKIVRQHYVTDEFAALDEANKVLALFAGGMEFWDYLASSMEKNDDLEDVGMEVYGYTV